jgi:hypothetical protein
MSFGVGDTIALIETCAKLANYIQQCKRTPKAYAASVHTLLSLKIAFSRLSTVLDKNNDARPMIDRLDHTIVHDISSEIRTVNAALRKCEAILKHSYTELSPKSSPLNLVRIRRKFQWPIAQQNYEQHIVAIERSMRVIDMMVNSHDL